MLSYRCGQVTVTIATEDQAGRTALDAALSLLSPYVLLIHGTVRGIDEMRIVSELAMDMIGQRDRTEGQTPLAIVEIGRTWLYQQPGPDQPASREATVMKPPSDASSTHNWQQVGRDAYYSGHEHHAPLSNPHVTKAITTESGDFIDDEAQVRRICQDYEAGWELAAQEDARNSLGRSLLGTGENTQLSAAEHPTLPLPTLTSTPIEVDTK
ncbi:hypothetical protein [Nocardia sp. NPDC050710]|uniref:hypothetical protein n=1 Tax=Nocardia sp. NPDC050710 TaxID=3157220 RepID=UPI0033D219B8